MPPKTTRATKIISEVRSGYHGLLKHPLNPTGGYLNLVPFIRIRGRWLADAGFQIGDDVQISVQPGQLIITKPT
jgi:hypothetical protein